MQEGFYSTDGEPILQTSIPEFCEVDAKGAFRAMQYSAAGISQVLDRQEKEVDESQHVPDIARQEAQVYHE